MQALAQDGETVYLSFSTQSFGSPSSYRLTEKQTNDCIFNVRNLLRALQIVKEKLEEAWSLGPL